MKWELASSNGESTLTLLRKGATSCIRIQSTTESYESHHQEIQLEFSLPISTNDLLREVRLLLEDLRTNLLDGRKSSTSVDVCDGSFALSPYNGEDLIEERHKQWYEISLRKEPTLSYVSVILLDITVIDQFMEASLLH